MNPASILPLLKPPKLNPGDTVAAVTLSWGGPGQFPHRYEAGKRQLEEAFKVKVVETRHALKTPAWIASNPQARADDLMTCCPSALRRKSIQVQRRFPLSRMRWSIRNEVP